MSLRIFFVSVINSSLAPASVIRDKFLAPLIVWITSLPVMPLAKGTEQAVKLAKEKTMNKVFNLCNVPFIVIIYDILVVKSIPKKASVYAMNLTMAHIKRPKLMMVTAGIPAYHTQSSRAPHSIFSRCLT